VVLDECHFSTMTEHRGQLLSSQGQRHKYSEDPGLDRDVWIRSKLRDLRNKTNEFQHTRVHEHLNSPENAKGPHKHSDSFF